MTKDRESFIRRHPMSNQVTDCLEEVDRLRLELVKLRDDIVDNAQDTMWCGPGETVCERITSILGDQWP